MLIKVNQFLNLDLVRLNNVNKDFCKIARPILLRPAMQIEFIFELRPMCTQTVTQLVHNEGKLLRNCIYANSYTLENLINNKFVALKI